MTPNSVPHFTLHVSVVYISIYIASVVPSPKEARRVLSRGCGVGGALGQSTQYNHILVMLLGEDMAEEFHYTYTIYSTQCRPGGCGVHRWGSRMYIQSQQDCTYILSKTAVTHVTQLSCSKLTHNDTVCNKIRCILISAAIYYRVKDRSHTSFKIQSGNFKCDLPIVSICLIQQCKVHKCEGQPIETTSIL